MHFYTPTFSVVLLCLSIHLHGGLRKERFKQYFYPGLIRSYYVSAKGSDTSDGSLRHPFKTVAKVNTVNFRQGDTLYFNGGETFVGTLDLSLNGTAERPIVVTSYGKGRATINGNEREAIIIKGSWFKISRINAHGSGRTQGNTTNGVLISSSQSVTVSDMRVEGFQKSGLELKNCTDAYVEKVVATNNGFCGIHVIGTSGKLLSRNVTVKDCLAENNPGDPTNLNNHSGNGILAGNSENVLIDHCVATNNGWDMPRKGNGPVGIWVYECNRAIIQYCISYKNRTAQGAQDGGGFDLDGGVTNSVIQYCLSYENFGAGYGLFQYKGATPWFNNTVRYCVSFNDAKVTGEAAGFLVWNETGDTSQFQGCNVYNNVVCNDKVPVVNFLRQSMNKDFVFYNNIFYGSAKMLGGPSSGDRFLANVWWSRLTKNIFFRDFEGLQAWSDATGHEKLNGIIKGMHTNPLLIEPLNPSITDPYKLASLGGYKLRERSPVKNKGIMQNALSPIPFPAIDFYGSPVPMGSAPEPGVFEIKE